MNFFLKNSISDYCKEWTDVQFDSDKISTTTLWDGTDSMINYFTNGNKDYTPHDISYVFNEYDFRVSGKPTKKQTDNIVACFGCSNTFGAGLPWEETWPAVLNKLLGSDWGVKNYGVSGASNDTIARLIHNYILKYNPKVICCFLPEVQRMEVCDEHTGQILCVHPQNCCYGNKSVYGAYKKLSNLDYCVNNFLKNYKFIESVCKARGIQFYWFTWSDFILNLNKIDFLKFFNYDSFLHGIYEDASGLSDPPKARDNGHFGKNVNKKIANGFFEKITNNLKEPVSQIVIQNTVLNYHKSNKKNNIFSKVTSLVKKYFINKIISRNDNFIY